MGRNIFDIQDDLRIIIDKIEENGGEVDEEIFKALELTEQDFKDKIDSYCQVITKYKSEDTCCKEEKSRINNIQNTKKNVIEKLKKVLLDAILKFGDDGKSGNKTYSTPTHKLFTKSSIGFETNFKRFSDLYEGFIDYMRSIYEQGILVTGDEMDIPSVLKCINENYKANATTPMDDFFISPVEGTCPEPFIPFTVEDLKSINANINFSCNLFDLFTLYEKVGIALLDGNGLQKVSFEPSEYVDNLCNFDSTEEQEKCTVGRYVIKNSLTIK